MNWKKAPFELIVVIIGVLIGVHLVWSSPKNRKVLFGWLKPQPQLEVKSAPAKPPEPEAMPTVQPQQFKPFRPLPATFTNSLGMKMIWVKPGTVNIKHKIRMPEDKDIIEIDTGYYLARTEVTQEQWEKTMFNNPSHFKGKSLPVETVSWHDAVDFCQRLTAFEREMGTLPKGYAYSLPTEAQCEYACRAGNSGNLGGQVDAMAWYDGNAGKRTHPVATKQSNAWGFYDMYGNTWEWCLERYVDFGGALRGSSWRTDFCGPGIRNAGDQSSSDWGFRPALVLAK